MHNIYKIYEEGNVSSNTLNTFIHQGYVVPSNRQKFKAGTKVKVMPYNYMNKVQEARIGQEGVIELVKPRIMSTALWVVKFPDNEYMSIPGAALEKIEVLDYIKTFDSKMYQEIANSLIFFSSLNDLIPLVDENLSSILKLEGYEDLYQEDKNFLINKHSNEIKEKFENEELLKGISKITNKEKPYKQPYPTNEAQNLFTAHFYFGKFNLKQFIANNEKIKRTGCSLDIVNIKNNHLDINKEVIDSYYIFNTKEIQQIIASYPNHKTSFKINEILKESVQQGYRFSVPFIRNNFDIRDYFSCNNKLITYTSIFFNNIEAGGNYTDKYFKALSDPDGTVYTRKLNKIKI
jgi:hypothetical protein